MIVPDHCVLIEKELDDTVREFCVNNSIRVNHLQHFFNKSVWGFENSKMRLVFMIKWKSRQQ